MNARIQVMVESRELEPLAAADGEVAARWRKAVQTYADSRKDLSADSVVTLCYQAGLQGAMAIVRAAGYRVRTAQSGHHRLTFEALRALEIPDLSPLGREMNDLRRRRHHAVYEWDDEGPDGESGIGSGWTRSCAGCSGSAPRGCAGSVPPSPMNWKRHRPTPESTACGPPSDGGPFCVGCRGAGNLRPRFLRRSTMS